MNYLFWSIVGLAFGIIFLLITKRFQANKEKRILSITLVITAVIYLGFAFVWGNTAWVFIELAGIPAYGLFVWASIRYSAYWLAIGWLLHPAWDGGLHLFGPGNLVAPAWYVVACISFDFLVAGYVFNRVNKWQHEQVR